MLEHYVTIDDLADYMEVDELIVENALTAIYSAEQSVRKYLGQEITSGVGVEYHDGTGKQVLRLRERPVRRVDAVILDDVQLDSSEWKLRGARIALPDGYFTYGYDNVAVQYLHGYDLTSEGEYAIPADIKLVTVSAARRIYDARGEDLHMERIEQIGKYSYTNYTNSLIDTQNIIPDMELLDSEKLVLDRYKINVVI